MLDDGNVGGIRSTNIVIKIAQTTTGTGISTYTVTWDKRHRHKQKQKHNPRWAHSQSTTLALVVTSCDSQLTRRTSARAPGQARAKAQDTMGLKHKLSQDIGGENTSTNVKHASQEA